MRTFARICLIIFNVFHWCKEIFFSISNNKIISLYTISKPKRHDTWQKAHFSRCCAQCWTNNIYIFESYMQWVWQILFNNIAQKTFTFRFLFVAVLFSCRFPVYISLVMLFLHVCRLHNNAQDLIAVFCCKTNINICLQSSISILTNWCFCKQFFILVVFTLKRERKKMRRTIIPNSVCFSIFSLCCWCR